MNYLFKITEGLLPGERILLIFGIISCISFLFLFIRKSIQDKNRTVELLSFIIPFTFLVSPTISKFALTKDGFSFEKDILSRYAQGDTSLCPQVVQTVLDIFESKNKLNDDDSKNLIAAQYRIGNTSKAISNIEKLNPKDTSDSRILEIKNAIKTEELLDAQLAVVKTKPKDTIELRKLTEVSLRAEKLPIKNKRIEDQIQIANKKLRNDYIRRAPN